MSTFKLCLISFIFLIGNGISVSYGALIFTTEENGVHDQVFYIDSGDTSDDFIDLEFGQSIDAKLRYDLVNNKFTINRDLGIGGGIFTLDSDNVGVGGDVDIIANQGSDSAGTLRYSAANDRWEISNNGGIFTGIAAGGTMLIFDRTLVDNGSTTLSHASDASYQRVTQIKELTTSAGIIDSSLDYDTADEGNFIQENAAAGTDFVGDRVILSQSFTGGSGTTNLAQGQTATASTSSQPASNAVDGDNNNFWYTAAANSNGGWLQVDMGAGPPTINEATIRWWNTSGTYNCSTFDIEGSNTDGSGYVNVWTGNAGTAQEGTYTFSPVTYRYWRFVCTVAMNSDYYVVREARLFEALAAYPTTPYYVTTNVNALNTTSWSGISAFNFTQTTPASTSIRHLVSFDGRTTWKYWNGAAWTNSSLANLQTQGMTEATIEAVSSAQWFAAGGINSNAAMSLDVAFDLDTNDANVTPSVDQLDVTFTTPNYWEVNTENYDIQEFNTNETQIINRTGGTKDIKITILIP